MLNPLKRFKFAKLLTDYDTRNIHMQTDLYQKHFQSFAREIRPIAIYSSEIPFELAVNKLRFKGPSAEIKPKSRSETKLTYLGELQSTKIKGESK